jgi:hypothetical protein
MEIIIIVIQNKKTRGIEPQLRLLNRFCRDNVSISVHYAKKHHKAADVPPEATVLDLCKMDRDYYKDIICPPKLQELTIGSSYYNLINFKSITKLTINNVYTIYAVTLKDLVNLTYLSVQEELYCSNMVDLPKLTHLKCRQINSDLQPGIFTRLKKLEIHGLYFSIFPNIECLSLISYSPGYGTHLLALTKLKHLKIKSFSRDINGGSLSQLTRLTSLKIKYNYSFIFGSTIAHLSNLEKLELGGKIEPPFSLSNLKKLKCDNFTYENQGDQLLSKLTRLTHLQIDSLINSVKGYISTGTINKLTTLQYLKISRDKSQIDPEIDGLVLYRKKEISTYCTFSRYYFKP